MVTTGNTAIIDKVQRLVRGRAKEFNIPDTDLEVKSYYDPDRNAEIVRLQFRTPDKTMKYQGEISIDPQTILGQQKDIVARELDELLESLEHHWLEEGGSVTFYKNHGFFYRFTQDGDKTCLKAQCTVCNHVEMVNQPRDILDEYRDVFLLKMLPKIHAKCDCPAGKYDSV